MKQQLLLIILLTYSCLGYSQNRYFQQKVNTTIDVKLNDENHSLSAFEKIEYINNSTETLDSIIFHLWPNAYKNVNTTMAKHLVSSGDIKFQYADSINRGYIDSLDFKTDGKKLKWEYYNNKIDIAVVYLAEPLKPGKSVEITTPFYVKIPLGVYSRLGHIGQSYQITQWFPKPAVYDRTGWHPLSYLSQGEFYSEFGNYDVKITLPENYVLGATGDLQNNPKEEQFLLEKVKQTEKLIDSSLLPILDSLKNADMSFPKSSDKYKTLHFHQENVHDFAFFADKRYHVLKGQVELPKSKRIVNTWAMFTNNEADLWKNSIDYLNNSTYFYSLWVGDYPYNHATAVDGSISAGGGMEYPNITVIGESYTAKALDEVITHEVGHNWFYGILGSNERKNAWMDEGMNSYVESRYMDHFYPVSNPMAPILGFDELQQKDVMNLGYKFNAARNLDQPIQMGASLYTNTNYGVIVYGKTSIGFKYLQYYLGTELFDRCMDSYFQSWKFKHPCPTDVRDSFEEVSGEDLSWFFDDFIKTTKKIDYKLQSVRKKDNNVYRIKIKNNTDFSAPTSLTGITLLDSISSIHTWLPNFENDTTLEFTSNEEIKYFALDYSNVTTDINISNNTIRAKGLFRKTEPLKFQILAGIEKQNKSIIYYTPIVEWNYYDKFMPGMAIYNHLVFERKFEYLIAPVYSINNKALNGIAEFSYNIHPDNKISKMSFGYLGKTYSQSFNLDEGNHRWSKNQISLDVKLKENKLRYSPAHIISIKEIMIDDYSISGNFVEPPQFDAHKTLYTVLDYSIKSKQFLSPKSLDIRYVYGNDTKNTVLNTISLTGNFRHNYNKRMEGIEFRFFAGYNLYNSENLPDPYQFHLTGQDGSFDYLYERTYLGRNTPFPNALAQQTSNTHGAFKINSFREKSHLWLTALNSKIELPKIPIGIFIDLGLYPIKTNTNSKEGMKIEKIYNSGIYYSLKVSNKEILSIYLPLLYSDKIADATVLRSTIDSPSPTIENIHFLQRITFIFNIQEINPFQIIRNIAP